MPATMLSVENLCAGYDASAPVLREVSFAVGAGEIAAVIGPNGCGKSTLLRCVAGLLAPLDGRVLLQGQNVRAYPPRERARRVAFLAQNPDSESTLTVEEAVTLGRTPHLPPYGAPSHADRAAVERALERTDTARLRARFLGALSGGERQRALLARALATAPQVLLLDEPTSHLDLRYQFEILQLVHHLARHEKLTVLLVLHQINLAAALADTMLLLDESGSTRACGTPDDVMTTAHLEAVYRVPLRISPHRQSGRPQAHADWQFATESREEGEPA